MPDYKTEQKVKAREENVNLYRALSGLRFIPKDRQYWTLANRQDASPDSEINQLVSLDLLSKSQFHGVDRSIALIEANRADHPEAHWHAGFCISCRYRGRNMARSCHN